MKPFTPTNPSIRNLDVFTDLESVERDDSCPMSYWWREKEAGSGILKTSEVVPDAILKSTQEDMRTIAAMTSLTPQNIESTLNEVLQNLKPEDLKNVRFMELLYRRLGWFAAYALYIEPEIRLKYEDLDVDEILTYIREPLWILIKPGRLLRNRFSKEIVYRAFVPVTTAIRRQEWLQQWHFNIKMHLEIQASNDWLKADNDVDLPSLRVHNGEVQGLSTGFTSSRDNFLFHPYVYGWRHKFTQDWVTSTTNLKDPGDYEQRGIWEYPLGIVRWVQLLGEKVAESQFPVSPPVFLNSRLLHFWTERVTRRHTAIRRQAPSCHTDLKMRNMVFPRHHSACKTGEGSTCPYLLCCWNEQMGNAPLVRGVYTPNPENPKKELSNE